MSVLAKDLVSGEIFQRILLTACIVLASCVHCGRCARVRMIWMKPDCPDGAERCVDAVEACLESTTWYNELDRTRTHTAIRIDMSASQ